MSLLLLAAGAALGLGACTTMTATPIDGPLATEAGFCTELAKAKCSEDLVRHCFASSSGSVSRDMQSCVEGGSARASCNPAGLPYHADAAEEVLNVALSVYSDGQLEGSELKRMNDAMAKVFNRGARSGSSCDSITDCDATNGLECVVQAGNGRCAVPQLVEAGRHCTDLGSTCEAGFYCDEVCRETALSGEDCSEGQVCEGNLRCSEKTGTCGLKFRNSEICTSADQCAGGFCLGQSSDDLRCGAIDQFAFNSLSCEPFY